MSVSVFKVLRRTKEKPPFQELNAVIVTLKTRYMHSVTAETPAGKTAISQAIRHKNHQQKVHKVAEHSNTLLLFSDRLCDDDTCNYIQILAVLPVSTSHIATGTAVQGHRPTCIK